MTGHGGGDDDITLGELGRNLNALREEIGKLRETFTGYVLLGVYQAEQRALELRVKQLEDSQAWMVRTVVGLVIVGVLGAVGWGTTR